MSCVKKEILIGGKEKDGRYACFVGKKGKKDKEKHSTVHAEDFSVVLLHCGLHI